MKKILYGSSLALALSLICGGCKKDDEFLKETPSDFLTTGNAYINFAQFKTGLNDLYRLVRLNYNNRDSGDDFFHFGSGTDNIFPPFDNNNFTDWNLVNPVLGELRDVYARHYTMIYNANTILAQTENPAVTLTPAQKLIVQAEARFFRAYAYRYLSYLFGGVPILDKPVTTPNLAYTRPSRAQVYDFCVKDFQFAAENLPQTTSEAGRLVKAAAYHHLAEMLIALGDESKSPDNYTKAIDAASKVIDKQVGDYSLMTQRFGWRKDIPGKNVFWDMFQMRSTASYSNYNYQNGNKEAIWVMQVDKFLTGGLGVNLTTRTDQERAFWPSFWALEKFGYSQPARDWTGRGISLVRPTNYFTYYLWNNSGPNDMRNSEVNIQRTFYAPPPIINGKEVPGYDTTYTTQVTLFDGTPFTVKLKPGDPIKKEWLTTRQDTMERVFPRVMKMGSDWHYAGDPSNGFAQESYAIRLAETYLVRAEAYMKAGDNVKAAADINAVRGRAGATPADPGEINIDYILDERIRELFGEELHTLTLTRLGLLYERTKKYGYVVSQQTVQPRNNLFPIPQSVIDANSQAEFAQNPGY
ncbi:MAG: RagB/SusD family nutrient uptake outer membrane protein [Bacteroidota bacterium]|nr:RagB/SusD family nutrient uptake outer membrane protein [Bacteroidota bacterium]